MTSVNEKYFLDKSFKAEVTNSNNFKYNKSKYSI